MLLLFSHELSEVQIKNAKNVHKIDNFLYLPQELQALWSNVPAELESLTLLLKPIKKFVEENAFAGDFVLVQGDFGMTYNMVLFCKEKGLVPIYATTERFVEEYIENTQSVKKSIFKFRRFREYE